MRLLLMDGNFFLYQACYGARARLLKRGATERQLVARGTQVFWSILRSLVRRSKATHLIVAFDGQEPTFRHELDERYKRRRKERPPEMPALRRSVYQLLKARGVFFYIAHDVEADDVIGTFTRLAVQDGFEVVICSGDNDLAQLVKPGVELWLVRTGQIRRPVVITTRNFHRHYPVRPEQIPDWKALLGDRSDTIPGVPHMTHTLAKGLLERYPHIAAMLNASDLKAHERRLLAAHREQITRNRILAAIRTDVDLYANWRRFSLDRVDLDPPAGKRAKAGAQPHAARTRRRRRDRRDKPE